MLHITNMDIAGATAADECTTVKTVPILISSLTIFKNNNIDSDSSESSDDNSESSSEDISLKDCQILYSLFKLSKTRGKVINTVKITDYVERVIPNYSRLMFKEHFRMFPETFEMVLSVIGKGLQATSGRKQISAEKQLLIAIWFMATPDSYRSICVKFGVGKATAFRALRRVTYALHCIAPRFIKWPQGDIAIQVMERFEASCGFPNVIGAIDGTHIKIRAPVEDAASYINRKGFPSINLQVVCDSRGLFTHCYAGQVGSVHDARVFKNSPVARFVNMPDIYFPNNSHIIGDGAYGIHPHVMVPFRNNGHLSLRQQNFNYCLSSTRMAIERTIGSLKVRFRILLDCLPLTDIKKIPQFIIACCVLHNICILKNDTIPVVVCRANDEIGPINRGNIAVMGNEKRIAIMNTLSINIVN